MADPKRLYLIDGANYLFRAYYAIRPLSNSKGLPTNALLGFTRMVLKLLKEESPDYVAVCFDTPEPTFRDELYEAYKANRKAPPDDLAEQFPYVIPIVEALSIAVVRKPGFEADDLIGTLAARFAAEGLEVVIVSGDKDLMQLVGEKVSILDEMKGLRVGRKEVEARFGVGPERVIDVLALAGDPSDNVPGVSGIGPKTASKLVAQYGSVEEILKRSEEIGGAVGKKLAEGVEIARLSKQLVTVDTSVPLEFFLKDFERVPPSREKMSDLFKELEFTKILDELAPRTTISYEEYRLVTEEKELKIVCNTLKKQRIMSVDLETDSLDPMRAQIAGFAIAWEPGEAVYVPVGHRGSGAAPAGNRDFFADAPAALPGQLPRQKVEEALRPLLADSEIRKVGQNLNYDLTILRRQGFEVRGVAFDTMLASYLLNSAEGHGLDAMASAYLGHRTIRYEEVVGKGSQAISFAEVAPAAARDYACEDADVALRLSRIFEKRIEEEGLAPLLYDLEMPLLDVLVAMQMAGVKVDIAKLSELGKVFGRELAGLEGKIHALAGGPFNINSPKQLGSVLFEKLRLPGGRATKTGYSTSQEVLEELASEHALPELVLRWRSLGKLISTYIDALAELVHPETGRVHTTFNQAVAATGRLSSSNPNMQNIPARTEEGRRIREAFIAEEGNLLLSADYSQIELRVLAHLSREPALLEAFARGDDVHALTAAGIFGCEPHAVTREQRAVGKTVNFATIYGQTAYGLSRQLGIPPSEAADYIERYFARYPRVAACRDEVLARARAEGRVETLFGRRRSFPDILSSNGQQRQLAERMAFNTVFQGSAADIIKRAMLAIHAGLAGVSSGARLLLQVHDELVLEVPETDVEAVRSFVKEGMEGAAKLDVPLTVDVGVGKNWAEAH